MKIIEGGAANLHRWDRVRSLIFLYIHQDLSNAQLMYGIDSIIAQEIMELSICPDGVDSDITITHKKQSLASEQTRLEKVKERLKGYYVTQREKQNDTQNSYGWKNWEKYETLEPIKTNLDSKSTAILSLRISPILNTLIAILGKWSSKISKAIKPEISKFDGR